MEQVVNDTLDAARYRAFRWLMLTSDDERAQVEQLLLPIVEGTEDPTPELLDAAMDAVAAYLAAL